NTNTTTSAPAQAIQACQRSSGNVAPNEVGGTGGLIVRPFSPPRKAGNLSASAGNPTANASVAPARNGPRSRLAARPTKRPTTSATTTPPPSAGISAQPAPDSWATASAPTAMNAP